MDRQPQPPAPQSPDDGDAEPGYAEWLDRKIEKGIAELDGGLGLSWRDVREELGIA